MGLVVVSVGPVEVSVGTVLLDRPIVIIPPIVGITPVVPCSVRQNLYSTLLFLDEKAMCVGGQELYLLVFQDLLINPVSSDPFPTSILTPAPSFQISIQNLLNSFALKIFDVLKKYFVKKVLRYTNSKPQKSSLCLPCLRCLWFLSFDSWFARIVQVQWQSQIHSCIHHRRKREQKLYFPELNRFSKVMLWILSMHLQILLAKLAKCSNNICYHP